jgi:hypothetical protein
MFFSKSKTNELPTACGRLKVFKSKVPGFENLITFNLITFKLWRGAVAQLVER